MRLLAGVVALTILAPGCVLHERHHGRRSSSALSARSCPPGHMWSDGQCHGKGKGHDPAKHER